MRVPRVYICKNGEKCDGCEFSLDLEDCLEENMPMLCLEIPENLCWIYDGKGQTYFELNTFAVFFCCLPGSEHRSKKLWYVYYFYGIIGIETLTNDAKNVEKRIILQKKKVGEIFLQFTKPTF